MCFNGMGMINLRTSTDTKAAIDTKTATPAATPAIPEVTAEVRLPKAEAA